MSATSTITSKGQTTIPKSIREKLNLREGDRLEFLVEDDGRVVLIAATVPVQTLKGILPAPKRAITLEDMDSAVRATARRRLERRR
ncbi:AbrB/MazE/SpoVT family DNA-binding domain-containing protein [soil metagenome]